MYIGKFRKAVLYYKRLSNISFQDEDFIVIQCLEFNEKLLQAEPDKLQCIFIQGYLYWKKKFNLPMALEKLEKFRDLSNSFEEYTYLNNVSKSYLSQIKSNMELK